MRRAGAWLARIGKRVFRKESAPLWALLLLATLVRLPLMPFQGYWKDLATYVTWGSALATHGFGAIYRARDSATFIHDGYFQGNIVVNAVAYPPGIPYLFAVVTLVYNLTLAPILHASLPSMMFRDGIGPFVGKFVLLLSDLATTVLLYLEARKRHTQRFAWLTAASFAFSPAVLYDGVIWGQTDALVMLPVLLAVFALFARRYAVSGVGFALAVLIKPLPAVLLPFVLLYLWRWARREQFVRFIVALASALLLLLAPIMIPRFQLFDMLANMRMVAYNDHINISLDAFNFWWLMNLQTHRMGSSLLGVKLGLLADVAFGVSAIVIAMQIWRRSEPANLCFGLALVAFGFFMFMGGQHERYMFPFLPLMLATLIVSERKQSEHLQVLYAAGTVLCLLNMMATIGAYLSDSSPMIPYVTTKPLYDFFVHYFSILAFVAAAYITATFAQAMRVFLSGRFTPLRVADPGPTDQENVVVDLLAAPGA